MEQQALSLAGKRIAISGAAGTLGLAMVREAIHAGARVAAIDRLAIEEAAKLAGVEPFGGVDLSQGAAADATFTEIAKRLGGLDGLVNIAGTFRWETLGSGSVETWDLLYSINLRTAVIASKSALRYLTHPGGRIVNIGAMAANRAGAGMGAYAASKSGVARLTEALAEELKEQGVTVNAVLPSIIDTPQNRADMPSADFNRWVKPEALARVIAFLLSDAAAAVTGALIPVAGLV
jgi:NAD(P)-dependent dehydrogenase (short-subunit alcohol dehydrogenase family)